VTYSFKEDRMPFIILKTKLRKIWVLSIRQTTDKGKLSTDKKCPYWGDSAQEYGIEVPLHDKKLLVWCATSAD
jgi:hypothetical protein